ncbi:uncharacterized protein LOC122249065 [Penaeus japonicus]|uniref:uncharacterized protein LOC122249065 n=1 Tax=Penaeus japonicus TaxID=27405 RepID=UPI001C70D062|nr:uncharacterized protein LOC122249065 [Penaeus japonicus]XP_042865553.1 uncharacterized protein LOC122249065 [Penaeus japonicus]XP_042865554.1 uncharacterized protein LOC122249065 [Penaeus japonicus]XP_042865555.1 uncharacterized protein LOC122249065 [Penaeus japonicus]
MAHIGCRPGLYSLLRLLAFLTLKGCSSFARVSQDDQILVWEDLREEVNRMTQYNHSCLLKDSQCWHDGTKWPLKESNPADGEVWLCRCDDDCIRYGDCCLDKAEADWGDGREEGSGRFNCREIGSMSESSILTGILMIDDCLPAYHGHPFERMCLQNVTSEAYTFVLDLAVTSRATNITYANYYCALCNNDALDLHNWTIEIVCNTKEILKDFSMVEFMNEATYEPRRRGWERYTYKTEEDQKRNTFQEKHTCFPKIKEFQNAGDFANKFGGRPCIFPGRIASPYQQVRRCHADWPDRIDFEKCRRYSLMVAYRSLEGKVMYKNPHCARCNFVNVSQGDLQCPQSIKYTTLALQVLSQPLCFSVLMDFRAGRCDEKTELWDPVLEICHKIHCGHLFKLVAGRCERDVEAYDSLSNSSLLDNSCPKKRLNITEYVPRSDGSIFVNASKKVYAKGEFEVTNDTQVLVCHNVSHYIDAFTAVHQYLTLVVLSISLVALALHIAVYILVPRQRNLPGKNLFSLSCCLFVAHILFLTGTRQTEVYGLCMFLSCSLHYFWLASFCWMNVMSVDVCRTFSSQVYRGNSGGRKTYLLYSLYAWTVPALVVALALLLEWVDLLPEYRPEYATKLCWINNRHGLALFFLLPVGAIVIENVVLFLVSTYGICRQMKAARYANVRSQSAKGPQKKTEVNFSSQLAQNHHTRRDRVRLLLYMKLGVIQGLTWLTGFIAAFVDIPACWYPFTVLNGLQGAFIFVFFDMKQKVAEAVWEAVTRRPWTKRSTSSDTRTTATGAAGHTDNKRNESSESYSESEGERLGTTASHVPLGIENTGWDRSRKVTQAPKGVVGGSPATAKQNRPAPSPSLPSDSRQRAKGSGRKTEADSVGVGGVRNGDLRGGVVRGKFDDEGPDPQVVKRRPKFGAEGASEVPAAQPPVSPVAPNQLLQTPRGKRKAELHRVVDLLQQLKESHRNSLDLPDLVHQLLLRSGASTGPTGTSGTEKLAKCRSFTEGADAVWQEDRHSGLAARLRLLEYSAECPTIHSLISSHGQAPPRDARLPQDANMPPAIHANAGSNSSGAAGSAASQQEVAAVGAVSPSCSPGTTRRRPASLNRTCSASLRSVDKAQAVRQEEPKEPVARAPLRATQSFSHISHVALAAAIMQRAATDARKRGRREGQQTPAEGLPHTRTSLKNTAESLV